jgi:hypothetical protein
MQAESQTMKRGDHGWNFSGGEQDNVISNVAELDGVMENLGFKRENHRPRS